MSTHHVLSLSPSEASPEDIIQGAVYSVDPGFDPNVTTATTHIAVVTQGSQTSHYSDAVNLSNDNDWHHMPLSEPIQTSPEVPHGPIYSGVMVSALVF
jgi:hypothetical protein